MYTFTNLIPPAFIKAQKAAFLAMAVANQTHSNLMTKASAAQKQGKWYLMQTLLKEVRENQVQAREEARQKATVQVA